MICVVFSTPGLIPIESFTTFGVNAKPNSNNPIGFFGTGLKYAIAVLLRNKQEVVLWRGQDKYTFYVKETDFRGKSFAMVRMKQEKWTVRGFLGQPKYTSLPFTTELGKNWELWQAYRELETNTRDEGGVTTIDEGPMHPPGKQVIPSTHITVYGALFAQEYYDRDRNFLPDGLTERTSSDRIQILDKPSKHVYYRGMRIMDLKEEAAYTYNFLGLVDLTEDRTAKYPWMLESRICEAIMEAEDPAFIDKVVPSRHYSGRTYYEHNLSYAYASPRSTSPAFMDAARVAKSSSVTDIWNKAQPTIPTAVHLNLTIPKSKLTDDELVEIISAIQEMYPQASMASTDGRTWQNPDMTGIPSSED